MFSYRHGFHAGNHADVLKHMVLVQLLEHMLKKDKPFWVVDTHAGGGLYDLASNYAVKSGEAEDGITSLWEHRKDKSTPQAVRDLIAQIAVCNDGDALRWYPGSPQIAAQMLREGDHLRLFELHPTEIKLLEGHFASVKRGVSIQCADGFASLRGCLPPPPRRGLVHIDPPYELKEDYRRVLQTVKEALTKFPTGTYAIWYPEVARRESQQLPGQLKRLAAELPKVDWLHATLRVKAAEPGGKGLFGSGMFIINPPWTLYDQLADALPWLVETIGQDEHAAYTLEAQQS
ncbi:MAG: 23S rRNA (adenine(2030)-N(6))-methyltransferase RlmJ [Aquabacterium sp.]|uniref:23S rRNA (adenine(2030)-N(6))-methyltransferase RlmJ n=1 Tax=Aquabacterium sp. TaxID=1872578 RepID=UPI0025BF41E3|nr:23S rRNA (adenine(2030)-N(6))-methyltransferase RlmJ [Aquabacterium sp.]MBI5927003.1 23S rRNA (adenine(2030)-N(6))-methyltransferase RlmJ [Aquabacterium sp.]